MEGRTRMSCSYENDLNLKATELRLGLPGSEEQQPIIPSFRNKKRSSSEISDHDSNSKTTSSSSSSEVNDDYQHTAPPAKAQVVGWPPVRSYRKNCLLHMQTTTKRSGEDEAELGGGGSGMYVKVSVDGAPYLRKIDLKVYRSYGELVKGLEKMLKLNIGAYSEREAAYINGSDRYAPTYQDKDGDWMLVGDVPWEMFISSCKRLRIMKGSEARGLGCL